MRIGLFGGSFDPVHHGHLLLAERTREKAKLDRVIFIPAGTPPHKHAAKVSAQDRLAMVRLAIRGNAAFTVSDWEIGQGRTVYSVETVEHFRRTQPQDSFYFLVGSDALKGLPRWHESARLRKLCRFTGIPRIDVYASTDIRRRVARGQSIRYLVPEAVERYIRERRLYR